jgi:glycerol-3-phosphate O-acyltransferase
VAQSLYRVRLGVTDEAALEAVEPDATVVFLMNHRSNMDYVLVSYLVMERAALSYAVGEWAKIWPLESLIRSMGAYFVRRGSGNPLYRKVLERYIHMATEAGVTQAVYPEGGLSRDGALRSPKLGVLDYMVRGFDVEGQRDLVFVPVGINYDRTLEDRTLLLDTDEPTPREKRRPLATTLSFVARNLALMVRNEWHRFGYACVNLGTPLSLREYLGSRQARPSALSREERFEVVAELAEELMGRVGRVIPVVPAALVATVLVRAPERRFSELELKAEALHLMERLEEAGSHVYLPRRDQDYTLTVGLRMLTLRHLVEVEEGLLRAAPKELPVLRYYANSVAHLVARIEGSEAG